MAYAGAGPLPVDVGEVWPRSAAGERVESADVDDLLIQRIARGDATAWPQLLSRHLTPIVSTAWRILGEKAEAEDVAQEAFIRLLRKLPQWQASGPPLRAWLHRVAVNLSIDRCRARRHVPLDEDRLADPSVSDVADIDRDSSIAQAMQRAMETLPDRQRVAVTLVHYQGFSKREAATMLSVSVHALESLLARARRSLRAQLEPISEDLLGDG